MEAELSDWQSDQKDLQIMKYYVSLLILHAEISSFMVFNPNPNKIYNVFYMLDAASLIDSISKCPKFTMS